LTITSGAIIAPHHSNLLFLLEKAVPSPILRSNLSMVVRPGAQSSAHPEESPFVVHTDFEHKGERWAIHFLSMYLDIIGLKVTPQRFTD
jgi:hypothetical protein